MKMGNHGLYLGVALTILASSAGRAETERYLYWNTFEQGDVNAPTGWERQGLAGWDHLGRTGQSLKIATWYKEGTDSQWISPLLEAPPGTLNLGAWTAQNLIFSQDPGYCGMVAAVCYDEQQQELSRDYVIKIPQEAKRSFFEGVRLVPEGLNWNYQEGSFTVPPGAKYLRLVFTWSQFVEAWRSADLITGEVWLDDLTLAKGPLAPPMGTEDTKALFPFQLTLNTPVDINLFTPTDPLEFNLLLLGEGVEELLAAASELELRYEVTDYHRLLVDEGRFPFSGLVLAPAVEKSEDGKERTGLGKTFYLGEKVRAAEGRWLALEVALMKPEEVLARGDISFAVLEPDTEVGDPAQHHFLRGSAQGQLRDWYGTLVSAGKPTPPNAPWGLESHPTWKEMTGEKGLGCLLWDTAWAARQPTAASPIDFTQVTSARPEVFMALDHPVRYEERVPAYLYMPYLQVQCAPPWAVKTRPDGVYDLDVEAYAQYVEAFARHSPATHFMITSTEGPSVHDYPDLVVAAAKAVKKVDSRLKVGAVAHIVGGKEAVQRIHPEALEALDIFVDDVYNARVNALPFKQELERLGYRDKEVWVGEYCDLSPKDQVGRARSLITYTSFSLAHGVDKLYWWASIGAPYIFASGYTFGEDLRGPYRLFSDSALCAGWRTGGGGPRFTPARDLSHPLWYPFLEIVTLHHVMSHLGYARNGQTVDLGEDTEAYLFSHDRFPGQNGREVSILAAFQKPGANPRHLALNTPLPYEIVDLYGRRKRVEPESDYSVITLGADPILAHFAGKVADLQASPSPLQVEMSRVVAPGNTEEVGVALTNPFAGEWEGEVQASVGPRWNITPDRQNVTLQKGETGRWAFSLEVPSDAVPGEYPLVVQVASRSGKVWGQIEERLAVQESLTLEAETRVATPHGKPEIRVRITNSGEQENRGQLSFVPPVTDQLRPAKITQEYALPGKGNATLNFPLDGVPERTRSYPVEFTLQPERGPVVQETQELFFIEIPKRKAPLRIDGEWTDWDVENLTPLRFFCEYNQYYGGGEKEHRREDPNNVWRGPEDASVTLYMAWDEEKLYWVADIVDDVPDNAGQYSGIWPYDCLHLCLYPWPFQAGEPVRGTPYKDHIGLDGNGQSTLDRVQSPVEGPPGTAGWGPPDTQFVARKTDRGYTFECAYGAAAIAPLKLEVGRQFRLAATYVDSDGPEQGRGNSGVTWFFGTANIEGLIDKFGQVRLGE